jgi:cysteine desulfurase family protein
MTRDIYLDNASTTFPKPDSVYEYMSGFYRTCGISPGRSSCRMAQQAAAMVEGARQKLTTLFHPSLTAAGAPKNPARLVFTYNASHSLNLIIQGRVGPGDHIVTTWMEHNSVLRPVNHLVAQGAEATFVRPGPDGRVDPLDIRRAIRPATTLVVVNHGSNVCGVVQDIQSIGAVCRDANVPLALDAAQTAGIIPIDMAAWHVSFVAFTGHKSLMGPTGSGGICVADDAQINSTMWGGTGVRSADPLHVEEYPWRLEVGTPNLLGIAGLSAGVDWITTNGLNTLNRQETALAARLAAELQEIRGVTVYAPTPSRSGVPTLSVAIAGWDPADLGTVLERDYHILTRAGLHCAPKAHEHLGTAPQGTVRFSVGPFNTQDDILTVIKAVGEIAAQKR